MSYRTVPKKSSLLTRCWTAVVLSSLRKLAFQLHLPMGGQCGFASIVQSI